MPDPFDVGQMRSWLRLETTGGVPDTDSAGDEVEDWKTVGIFPAKVQPLFGRELFVAQQVKSTLTHRITMRVECPISPQDRLVIEGTNRIFNVESVVDVDERGAYYEITASQVYGEGTSDA